VLGIGRECRGAASADPPTISGGCFVFMPTLLCSSAPGFQGNDTHLHICLHIHMSSHFVTVPPPHPQYCNHLRPPHPHPHTHTRLHTHL
jgi:hypothetical protein